MKLFFIADPAVKRVVDFQKWFEKRLDDAIQAAEKEQRPKAITYEEENKKNEIKNDKMEDKKEPEKIVKPIIKDLVEKAVSSGDPNGAKISSWGRIKPLSALSLINNSGEMEKDLEEEKKKVQALTQKLDSIQKEIEKLEGELLVFFFILYLFTFGAAFWFTLHKIKSTYIFVSYMI